MDRIAVFRHGDHVAYLELALQDADHHRLVDAWRGAHRHQRLGCEEHQRHAEGEERNRERACHIPGNRSGITFAGIGSAYWGLAAGLILFGARRLLGR